jgi:hypothetical protein
MEEAEDAGLEASMTVYRTYVPSGRVILASYPGWTAALGGRPARGRVSSPQSEPTSTSPARKAAPAAAASTTRAYPTCARPASSEASGPMRAASERA